MARRVVTAALLAGGSYVGGVLYRRRVARRRSRVDLYHEDGSLTSLPEGSPEAQPLLAVARELLDAGRP